jgi:Flp pilus assembly protein TadB
MVVLVGAQLRIRPEPRVPIDGPPARRHRLRSPIMVRFRRRTPVGPDPAQVATWCDDLAGAIRSGSTLAGALREVSPPPGCAETVETIRLSLSRGSTVRQACMVDSCPVHLDVALTVLRACAEHGGSAAQPLSRTATVLRQRGADAAERRTHSSQAHLSAIVMTVLPIAMLVLLTFTSATVRSFIASPAGVTATLAGASLNLLGWRWMRRLVQGDDR